MDYRGCFARGHLRAVAFVCCAGALTVLAGPVIAYERDLPELSDEVFVVSASNEAGQGGFVITIDEGNWDPNAGIFDWTLPKQVDIYGAKRELIASILNAHLHIDFGDEFNIEMSVGVFSGTTTTDFDIASAFVTFDHIPAEFAMGRGVATFTVTDLGVDGVCMVGEGGAGLGAARCYYNGYLEEGSLFAHLVSVVCASGGSTADATQSDPDFGYMPFGEDVYDISTRFAFTMTANDLAFALADLGGPVPPPCVGDVNGDWEVGLEDLGQLLAAFGTVVGDPDYDPDADLNDDGVVDSADLGELLSAYEEGCFGE